MLSAIRSAIASVDRFVFARGIVGMIESSARAARRFLRVRYCSAIGSTCQSARSLSSLRLQVPPHVGSRRSQSAAEDPSGRDHENPFFGSGCYGAKRRPVREPTGQPQAAHVAPPDHAEAPAIYVEHNLEASSFAAAPKADPPSSGKALAENRRPPNPCRLGMVNGWGNRELDSPRGGLASDQQGVGIGRRYDLPAADRGVISGRVLKRRHLDLGQAAIRERPTTHRRG